MFAEKLTFPLYCNYDSLAPFTESAPMDVRTNQHPTDQTLSSYGLGKLDNPAAEGVNNHLEVCSDCREKVAKMSADCFLERVREARKPAGIVVSSKSQPDGKQSSSGKKPTGPPPADTLPTGLVDHPDYTIRRELGRGGMGVVYLAHNTLMGRDEVLKVMGREIMERAGVLERFHREIRAVAKLRHANIVTAYHATRRGESIIFAMEYVQGYDLAQLVKGRGPLPVPLACNFIYQAAQGLQHAHEEGLVHRDIKPANLMLSKRGDKATIKVLDFGLAKATREVKVDGGLTFEGQALGTPDFIAPEQIVDAQSADIRADIYSLGGTLYYLLTGRPPFEANSLYDIYQAHISRDADPLNLIRPEVPAELAALVAKMMAKDPARRFQTPAEVALALTPFFKKGTVTFASPKGDVSQPAEMITSGLKTRSLPTPAPPATGAGVLDLRSEKADDPNAPNGRWNSLIDFREPERSTEEAKPEEETSAGLSRRPPWVSRPLILAGSLFGFVAMLGVDAITITIENGRFKLSVEKTPKPAHVPPQVEVDTGPAKIAVEPKNAADRDPKSAAGPGVKDITSETKRAAETNPWPRALLAGQKFPQGTRFLAMSRDCQRVAVTSATGNLQVILASDPSKVVEVKGQPRNKDALHFVWGADFSPDGHYLAGGCNGSPVKIWATSTGEEVRQIDSFGYIPIYSPDGKRLARPNGLGKVVEIRDSATGDKVISIGPHSLFTNLSAFSPDGKQLAGGGEAPTSVTSTRSKVGWEAS